MPWCIYRRRHLLTGSNPFCSNPYLGIYSFHPIRNRPSCSPSNSYLDRLSICCLWDYEKESGTWWDIVRVTCQFHFHLMSRRRNISETVVPKHDVTFRRYLEFGDSARSTLSLGPLPLLSTAPLRFSMASAAYEARSNLT